MIERVDVKSRDYWVKFVEMLQQNWALVDTDGDALTTIYPGFPR
jgi:hypothetical protein